MTPAATLPACPSRPNLNLPPVADVTEYETRFCEALRQDRWEAAVQHPEVRAVVTAPLDIVSNAQHVTDLQAAMPNALVRSLKGAGRALANNQPEPLAVFATLNTVALLGLISPAAALIWLGAVTVLTGTAVVATALYGAITGYKDTARYDCVFKRDRTEQGLRRIEEQAEFLEPPVLEHMLSQLTANEGAFTADTLRPLYDRAVNELQTALRRVELADRHAARVAAKMNRAA